MSTNTKRQSPTPRKTRLRPARRRSTEELADRRAETTERRHAFRLAHEGLHRSRADRKTK